MKLALFDLDGVIIDTESQYSVFWANIGKNFLPEIPDFAQRIKGQSLVQIYRGFFGAQNVVQAEITKQLDAFEKQMTYPLFDGVVEFLDELQSQGIPAAVVTSSNLQKMENVVRVHPHFSQWFTRIFTAEDSAVSKPAPDCYLNAAQRLGFDIADCVVFEDSLNGLKSGRAAGARVLGIASSHPVDVIVSYSDFVVEKFGNITLELCHQL